MPNRYNGQDYSDRKNPKKHIRNTDNESTRFFDIHSDNESTAQFSTSAYRRQQPQNHDSRYDDRGYYNNPEYNNGNYYSEPEQEHRSSAQSRSDYYGSDSPVNRRQSYTNSTPGQDTPRKRSNTSSGKRPPSDGSVKRRPSGSNNSQQKKRRPPDSSAPVRRQEIPPVKKKKKKKKRSFISKLIIRILTPILTLFLLIFGIYSCTAVSLIKNLNYEESGKRNHSASALSASHVTNILLIGTDGRTVDDRGRSDTMILLSVNKKTDKIILTSFMRDSYVSIAGHGQDKLSHAYAYGGPDLLMDTIENNFSVRIDDYVSVNFTSFASIVDAVGGIEIEISDAEAQEINTILMAEVNELMGDPVDSDLLEGGGKVKLNGKQTLAYARIRHVGNADFERTERQRRVLTEIAGKLKSFSPSMISEITDEVVPNVTTNMKGTELYFLSLRLPFLLKYDIAQIQVPANGTYGSVTTSSGGAALEVDFEANKAIIKEEVFAE